MKEFKMPISAEIAASRQNRDVKKEKNKEFGRLRKDEFVNELFIKYRDQGVASTYKELVVGRAGRGSVLPEMGLGEVFRPMVV